MIYDLVRPEREQNNRAAYRERWWKFGENVHAVRKALDGLPRFIGTVYTAKHRIFQFISTETLVDATINIIALESVRSSV